MLDYSLWLSLGLWVFFLANLLLPVPAGRGIAYLNENRLSLYFPSWRSTFFSRRLLIMHPWHSLRPVLPLSLFHGPTTVRPEAGVLAARIERLLQIDLSLRGLRWLIIVTSLLVQLGIPAVLLLRGGSDGLFLVVALLAYVLYALTIVLLFFKRHVESRTLARSQWKIVLEPLLCLPYVAQMLRKVYMASAPITPLIDILQSTCVIRRNDLELLNTHLAEMLELIDKPELRSQLQLLQHCVATRLNQGNPNEIDRFDRIQPAGLLAGELAARGNKKTPGSTIASRKRRWR